MAHEVRNSALVLHYQDAHALDARRIRWGCGET
jgi:hypothetical protein